MKVKVTDKSEGSTIRVVFLGRELEEAHTDYLKRRNEIVSRLFTIWKDKDISAPYRNWLSQAAKFIVERDI